MGRRNSDLELKVLSKWPVPSRPPVSPPEARPPGSSLPPRLLGSLPLLQEVSRSPTGIGLELLPFVRSGGTRSPPSSSSASCPSSVWSGRLPRISRLTRGSSHPLSWLFRRHLRLTLLVSLRTPTCAPSMLRGSPSCPRTSSWPAGSVVSVLKEILQALPFSTNTALFRAKM